MPIKRILLVDDDEDDQLFFVDAIKQIDETLHCDIAGNGHEALGILKNPPVFPDVIFLDLNMPQMNGYECLVEIKKTPRLKNIPVVIFTTSNMPFEKERSKEMGAHLFFSKPNNFKSLKDGLEEILQKIPVNIR